MSALTAMKQSRDDILLIHSLICFAIFHTEALKLCLFEMNTIIILLTSLNIWRLKYFIWIWTSPEKKSIYSTNTDQIANVRVT